MAEGSVIGALRFILGADTAQLEASTAKASKSLRDAARAGEVAGAAIANALIGIGSIVAGAFAVERIVSFTSESLGAAAALGRFADQAGLSVRQFEGLDFALRDARVPTEQLAQGFAIFSRNLSDLHRGTGPFLDFLRRYAPQMVAQFKATTDTAEAFSVLTDAVNGLGDNYDRVRLLTAAGAEQFVRLNNTMRQGRPVIEEQTRAFQGLGDEAVRRAQEIEKRWDTMTRNIRLAFQQAIVGAGDPDPAQRFEQVAKRIEQLEVQLADRSANAMRRRFEAQAEYNNLLKEQIRLLGEAYLNADRAPPPPPPAAPRTGLTPDQIRAAQGELALFMARLQQLPPQTDFISSHFAAAWERMRAVMAANNETASAIAAARINLLRQENAARTQVLGNAMLVAETLARREQELFTARSNNLISETELQRALNVERLLHNQARTSAAQSLGVVLTVEEQYLAQLERIRIAEEQGATSVEMLSRARAKAARDLEQNYLDAASAVAGALSKVFNDNKAVAIAAAIIDTYAAANKALNAPPGPPVSYAYVAAALATGFANVRAIMSTNEKSRSVSSAPSAGGGGAEAPAGPMQTLTVRGLDPNAILSGASARDLAETLLAYQRDGGQVILQ